ncbi:hypothetical protein BLD44_028410 [Mastigocladus laminosus UU774]|nr:hypothetical protein BLD44_028410 [Mastigocladus laminosus UU774]
MTKILWEVADYDAVDNTIDVKCINFSELTDQDKERLPSIVIYNENNKLWVKNVTGVDIGDRFYAEIEDVDSDYDYVLVDIEFCNRTDRIVVCSKLYHYQYYSNKTTVWDDDGNREFTLPGILDVDLLVDIIKVIDINYKVGVRVGRGQVQDEMKKY